MSFSIITSASLEDYYIPVEFEGFCSNIENLLRAGWSIEKRYNPYNHHTMVYFKSYIRNNSKYRSNADLEQKIPMLARGGYSLQGIKLDFLIQQHRKLVIRSISDYDLLVFKNMGISQFEEKDIGELLEIIKDLQAPKQRQIIREMALDVEQVDNFVRKLA